MLGFFNFILNTHPLTRYVISSRVYFVGKNMRRECQMNILQGKIVFFSIIVFFLLVETIIEIMRKPIFTEKKSLILVENV